LLGAQLLNRTITPLSALSNWVRFEHTEVEKKPVALAAHREAMADKRMTKRIACERSEAMGESVGSSYLPSFALKRLKLWCFVGRPTESLHATLGGAWIELRVGSSAHAM